jgi:hypothetical protein
MFFNAHAGLADKRTFKRFIAPLRHIKWVVYCKAPFAGPQQVRARRLSARVLLQAGRAVPNLRSVDRVGRACSCTQ